MAFDLFFEPPTFNVPPLAMLRAFQWNGLPEKVKEYVAIEEQSLRFNIQMLKQARHTRAGAYPGSIPYNRPLGLSLRAAFVKSVILQSASIVEAVMRHVAEERGYPLPSNPKHRTMGKVLFAWSEGDMDIPRSDISSQWTLIRKIHDIRNNIHIFKAVDDPTASVESILQDEDALIPSLIPLLSFMSQLLRGEIVTTVTPSCNVVSPPPPPPPPPPPLNVAPQPSLSVMSPLDPSIADV